MDNTGASPRETRLFGPDMLDNPYPVYARLRTTAPVLWSAPLNAWVVTRFDDVSAVLKDRRLSSDRVSTARHRYGEKYRPVFDILSRIVLQTDDPKHAELRDLIHDAFMRSTIEHYEDRIRGLCRRLLEPGLKSGGMEFLAGFAAPLPILVISTIVGVPEEDRAQIKRWCDAYSLAALNFYVHLCEDQLDYCLAEMNAFRAYLADRVAAARAAPGPGLLSALTAAADTRDTLDDDDVIANCMLLLNAGNETTTCLLTNGLYALLENPDQMALLRAAPDGIANAVEELLRLQAPVQFLGRIASETIELGGKTIGTGELVLPVIGAANRDPDAFEDPDRLNVTRPHLHQLAFGSGPHLCAGIHLARFEAKIAFEELLSATDAIDLDTDALPAGGPAYSPNFNMRCLSSLPIRMTPSS